jgi:hypothetical protein
MSLESFRAPTTPESRTHRVVLLLIALGLVRSGWGLFVGSRYSAEIAIGATVAAVAYAVWRYLSPPAVKSNSR